MASKSWHPRQEPPHAREVSRNPIVIKSVEKGWEGGRLITTVVLIKTLELN